ncbi:MAG: MBL fold metallo-hydrolase [Acidobacteria bacterium]|nr:MBL fold metallo-hydrolase [Acidobacteriota bacterium]
MSRRGLVRLLAAAALAAGIAWLPLHLGWSRVLRPWQEVTGWNEIPPAQRGTAALDWPAALGEPPRLDWLGHAGFLVRWHGRRLLLDPNLSERCTVSPRLLERPLGPEALGPIDAVLLSHAHYDHMDAATLRALPSVGALVVPAGSEDYVRGLRADARVLGLAWGAATRFGEVEVVAVPAAHNGSRYHPLASAHTAAGYVLRAGGASLYFAGDTGRRNDFEAIARAYHPRLAILPIGGYAPSFPLRRYHLSPEDAVDVARRLGVAQVIPCHFGTFVVSLDGPGEALPRFARAAARARLPWTMPRLARPEPGAVAAAPRSAP